MANNWFFCCLKEATSTTNVHYQCHGKSISKISWWAGSSLFHWGTSHPLTPLSGHISNNLIRAYSMQQMHKYKYKYTNTLTFGHLWRVILDPSLQLGQSLNVPWRWSLHSVCLCPGQNNQCDIFFPAKCDPFLKRLKNLLAELDMPLKGIITKLSPTEVTRLRRSENH